MTPRNTRKAAANAARSPLEVLGAFIAKSGLKHSRQRDLIVEAFFEMGGHVPVEALVTRVREEDPHVSVATVYRTMKLLAECGLAEPRQFADGTTRYEVASGRHHHDHLICTECGAIDEFESDAIEEMQLQVARDHGFEVERHKLEIYGRCQRCRHRSERRREVAR
jgi:Fur family ferric uptake transcriptional regulator